MTPETDMSIFVRVVERGSFAAVAEEVGLTPSGISKLVTRLEDRLGVKLLQRTTRQLSLTPEGEIYLARSRDILATIEAAEAEVTAARGKPRGLIRVNTGTAFGKHMLTPALPAFFARYPDISMELSIADRRVDLIAEQADVAIRTGQLGDSSLVSRRITGMHRVICASPAYLARHGTPQTASDLVHHNCLKLSGFWRLAQWPLWIDGRIAQVQVKGNITCDSAELMLDMALQGLGIVRISNFLGQSALDRGDLVPILTDVHADTPADVTALMPPGRQNLTRVRAFVDFLIENFDSGAASKL